MTEYWKIQMQHEPTKVYYETIRKIVNSIKPKNVLEVGTGWGISGSAFLNEKVKSLMTIDPNIDAAYGKLSRAEMESKKGDCDLVFVDGRSESILQELKKQGKKFDLIYIDGDHGYDGCVDDLFLAHELLTENGKLLLDDFLHVKNLKGENDPDGYGIVKAVREYLLKTGKTATIYPTKVNAFVLIN